MPNSEENKKPFFKRPIKIWKLTLPLWIVAISACCSLTLICGGVFSGLEAIGLIPSSTPTLTNTPKPTSTITYTPQPTSTQTNTPLPTNTYTPQPATQTQTSTPTTSAAEVYTNELGTITLEYTFVMNDFSELMADASNDASLMFEDEWRNDVATALATIRLLNEDIRSLKAPPELQDAQDKMLLAADHMDTFTELTAEGIDEVDVNKILEATEHLETANQLISEAADLLTNE